MSESQIQCKNFSDEHPIHIGDKDFTAVVSPIATGVIGTHHWNHARAQEGKRKVSAIYCHDVTECTFVIFTAKVPGKYPLTWSFHAPPASLPGSSGKGNVEAPVQSFYERVVEESGRLSYKAGGRLQYKVDFDLIIVGVEAFSIDVDKMVAELSKSVVVKSIRPLVHMVTEYRIEMFTEGEWRQNADGTFLTGTSEEHTCYDMYFFLTECILGMKLIMSKGKGKNKGIEENIYLPNKINDF